MSGTHRDLYRTAAPSPFSLKPVAMLLPLLFSAPIATAQQADTQLKTMVVSAGGFEQEINNAPASISIITREQLEEKGITSLADAVADVAGVDIEDRNPSGNKTGNRSISMRGLPSAYTLVLIDGRRQNVAGDVTPNSFNDSGSMFIPPVSAIERIEVIRGPMSTLYGSDALGGVVNIITRKPGKQWTGELTLESTFQDNRDFGDSRAASLFLGGPIAQDVLGLQFYSKTYDRDESTLSWPGQSTRAGNILTMGQNPVKAHTQTHGVKFLLTPNKDHDIALSIDQARQKYDNKNGEVGTLNAANGAVAGYDPRLKFDRDQYALTHTWRFGSGFVESSLMQNTTETIGRLIPTRPAGSGTFVSAVPGKLAGTPRQLETESLVFDSKLVKELGAHTLSLGGQWIDGQLKDGVASKTLNYTQTGLFIEDEWRFLDNMALTLGARHNDHSIFGTNLSPRAYLVWNATPSWTLKGGIARGFRAPSLDQIADSQVTGFGAQGALQFIGNGKLDPELSTSHEISATYDNQRDLRASLTLFQTDFRNKITLGQETVVGGQRQRQWMNIEDAEMHGIELEARWMINPAWMLQGGYTYTQSEHKSGDQFTKGTPLANTPEHSLNATLRWQATDKLGTWVRGEYRSERYRAANAATAVADRAKLGDYKAYTLVDLGASYKVNKHLSFSAAVNNVFDKDFVDYELTTVANTYSNRYHQTLEGRRLWVSMNLAF
jgi:outer membrane receptor for ferrienterochelin and colicins